MSNEDRAIKRYHSLHPTDFRDLERLEIRQTVASGMWDVSLEVELRAKDKADIRRLILSFGGVKELKLTPPTTSVLYFSFIQVISIQDKGWENEKYKVFESEQDTEFSFICRDFNAKILPS